ncbi:hypothetical protein ScPMuIL_000378 [Solemya velum]
MCANWGYSSSDGPKTWHKHYPHASGKKQSPIDIRTKDAKVDRSLRGNSLYVSYGTEKDMELQNTGASVKASIKGNSMIFGGPLKDKYRLEQFHLHWGSDHSKGSEHTVDGHSFAAELHLVHWNADRYPTFKEAVDKEDGLAVLGVLFKVSSKDNASLDPICKSLQNISQKDKTCHIDEEFNPKKMIPESPTDYWTYPGSLTTPPCFESVTWIVFREIAEISENQLNCLRTMKNSEKQGQTIVNNYRPPLPLNGRSVRATFDSS